MISKKRRKNIKIIKNICKNKIFKKRGEMLYDKSVKKMC